MAPDGQPVGIAGNQVASEQAAGTAQLEPSLLRKQPKLNLVKLTQANGRSAHTPERAAAAMQARGKLR